MHLERHRHRYCTRNLLRLQTTWFKKITGVDSNRKQPHRQLQLRMLVTKEAETGMIPGMPEVNRQLKGDHLLGEIFQLSSCN